MSLKALSLLAFICKLRLLVIVTISTAALDKGNSMRHMILTGTLMLALSTSAMASQV